MLSASWWNWCLNFLRNPSDTLHRRRGFKRRQYRVTQNSWNGITEMWGIFAKQWRLFPASAVIWVNFICNVCRQFACRLVDSTMGLRLCSVQGDMGSRVFNDNLKDFWDPLSQVPHIVFFCQLTVFSMYMFTCRTLIYWSVFFLYCSLIYLQFLIHVQRVKKVVAAIRVSPHMLRAGA
jgi:hypothetical protein